jgi:transposase
VRSALEWAQVRALAANGVSQREIAVRLGINRRTVKRLVGADAPPRYERAPSGSILDPLVPVIRKLIEECPEIRAPRVTETLRDDYGYTGSVDLVRKRIATLRPPAGGRAAQRTGYRPGQVMQVDWAEMPTRPRVWGRERRVYALVCSLPFSGAATAHFTFDRGRSLWCGRAASPSRGPQYARAGRQAVTRASPKSRGARRLRLMML